MAKNLVVANWKSNGSLAKNLDLLTKIKKAEFMADVVICPPTIYLASAHAILGESVIALGAQNMSEFDNGAYTGEVSAAMLKEFAVKYVILGHSERRSLFAENTCIGTKVAKAVRNGLTPILCVGESLQQRQAGEAKKVVLEQLKHGIAELKSDELPKITIAYEPVWAIGTGKTASSEDAEQMHAQIRQSLFKEIGDKARDIKILYGGSVNETNAKQLFSMPNIDGGLIGGASLDSEKFLYISRVEG